MRRIRLHLLALAVVLLGMVLPSSSLFAQEILVNLTNQVWRYDQSCADPGAFWDPLYDDSLWPEGRGIFAFETSSAAALTANVYPYTNTVLNAPNAAGGCIVVYFRTHFTFNPTDTDNYVLVTSNLIDDGYVMYLNGVEVDRYNMNPNDAQAAGANPGGEGIYVVRTLNIPSGTLVPGDNVLAVRVYQNALTSSDVVWGTWIHSSLGYRPRILSPTATVDVAVDEGRSTNLTVTVDAAPPASLQWYFIPGGSGAPQQIVGQTGNTLAITDMSADKVGHYYVEAVNTIGSSNSPVFNVTMIEDVTPPTVAAATGSATDPTVVTIVFSENVVNANDYLYYFMQATDGSGDAPVVITATYGSSSNVVVLNTDPRDPTKTYELIIQFHAIADFFGNPLAEPTVVQIGVPKVFQDGLLGYNGTQDTEVAQAAPTAIRGQNTVIGSDLDDPSGSGNDLHSLVRFDGVVGGSGVPLRAIVTKATLRIWTEDQGSSPIQVVRMLVPWDENSTWNSLVNGIDDTNGVESILVGTIDSSNEGTDAFDDVDVTATVQAWVNNEAENYGWAFIPVGNDGWDFRSSEHATQANRPMLIVEYSVTPSPCDIEDHPESVTLDEKQGFTLTVLAAGSDLSYQWFKDDVAIPGATGSDYAVARAVPADSGTYHVVVSNPEPSECISTDAVVTVIPDTAPPSFTALGNENQTTITVTFNDSLDPTTADNPANYTLSGGINIIGLSRNGNVVTLTNDPARVVGNNYDLTVSNVRDDAVALNVISPNPTTTNLWQRVRVLPFSSVWKYEANGLDLGTTWKDPLFDDSSWQSANTLLGFENGQATLDALAALGLNTNNAMAWSLTRPDTTAIITWYLRNSVNIPYDLSGGGFATLRQVIDDGSVYYFNGEERFRFDMPAGEVTYTTEAVGATGEGVIRSQVLTNIACGPNVIAVSVHNDSPTSSDILFDAELLVTVPTFSACSTGGATLSIVNNLDGTVTLSWTGSGTLQESSDLTNWTAATNQANPQTFAPVGVKFYRVQ